MKSENKDSLTEIQTKERTERLKKAYNRLVYEGVVKKHEDVAKAMGATRPSVSAALSGDARFLTLSFLRRFGHAFSDFFDTEWLVSGKGEMEKPKDEPREQRPEPIDHSSLVNAALAAKDETIAALRAQITILEGIIKNKDEVIAMLRRSYQPSDLPAAAEN